MMSTYFHGGSDQIQSGNDNLQTLYLMNPNYITPYTSDAPNSNPNMLLFNPSGSNQQFFGIPLTGGPHSQVYYNPWSPTGEPEQSPVGGPMGFRRPSTGGLSLSLSHNNNNGPVQGVMVGSKYLKAAQELLDEVVNYVGRYTSGDHKEKRKGCVVNKEAVVGGGGGEKVAEELGSGQREELQMKKAKLLSMLDEVEERHRQYHSQTQVLISSFEQATGIGSAKSYTSLALHTISKQFKCLKGAIMSQIKATSTSLGEVYESNGGGSSKIEGGGVGSRLRFVDHQLRQQRALQQLGMMQHNAWRPQRGLPERAVSVLRAWLFEHFLHPYPKDSEKQLLAKQTGLTRSQVSNWFINARVRLWKPMVEEMYLEEVKTQEQNNPNSENKTNINNITNIGRPSTVNDANNGGADMETLIARSPKKQQSMQISPSSILSMDGQQQSLSTTTSPMINTGHHHQGFNSNNPYFVNNDMMGRFNPDHQFTAHQYHGNNNGTVSLTLGLPHREDQTELCGISMGMGQTSNPSNGYESIVNIRSRKRFVAHQLMHDFVA